MQTSIGRVMVTKTQELADGPLMITETTRRGATPERLRVVLSDRISNIPLRAGWSNASGVISFDLLSAGPWVLTVYDHTSEFAPESMIRTATVDGAR